MIVEGSLVLGMKNHMVMSCAFFGVIDLSTSTAVTFILHGNQRCALLDLLLKVLWSSVKLRFACSNAVPREESHKSGSARPLSRRVKKLSLRSGYTKWTFLQEKLGIGHEDMGRRMYCWTTCLQHWWKALILLKWWQSALYHRNNKSQFVLVALAVGPHVILLDQREYVLIFKKSLDIWMEREKVNMQAFQIESNGSILLAMTDARALRNSTLYSSLNV